MAGDSGQLDGEVRAQAAAWLARLRSEERSAEDEAGFRAWLAESAANQRAFDWVNQAWDAVGAMGPERRRATLKAARRGAVDVHRRAFVTAGVGALAVTSAFGIWRTAYAGVYETAVGEQRRVALDDGSLLILDTDTRLRVSLGEQRRAVELIRGRAHFEVAKDATRPFVVSAGDKQVVAVGTAFDVSRAEDAVAVVVMEGQVAIHAAPGAAQRQPVRMVTPGKRVVFAGPVREDRPDIAKVTAWQTGRAVFENEPVASAVAEMNRYSRRPIVVADPAAAQMTVSGVYSTGDTEAFARSLATLLPLDVSLEADRVTLSKKSS